MTPVETPAFPAQYLAPKVELETALETVVQNLENFHSTVLMSSKDADTYARRRFVTQRYQLGETMLVPSVSNQTGRRVYTRQPITPSDTMTVGSLMVLPASVVEYSRINLPGADLLTRTNLSRHPLHLFRLLGQRSNVQTHTIGEFGKDMDATYWLEEKGMKRVWDAQNKMNKEVKRLAIKEDWRNQIQEFVLDEQLDQDPDRYRQYLTTVLPATNTLVELASTLYPTRLSQQRMTDALEPYLVYREDLHYKQ
jgi:hypothetical protein